MRWSILILAATLLGCSAFDQEPDRAVRPNRAGWMHLWGAPPGGYYRFYMTQHHSFEESCNLNPHPLRAVVATLDGRNSYETWIIPTVDGIYETPTGYWEGEAVTVSIELADTDCLMGIDDFFSQRVSLCGLPGSVCLQPYTFTRYRVGGGESTCVPNLDLEDPATCYRFHSDADGLDLSNRPRSLDGQPYVLLVLPAAQGRAARTVPAHEFVQTDRYPGGVE